MKPEFPFKAPEYGEVVRIADGIEWLRWPLPMALDHLNVYILEDNDGVTIVDTGLGLPNFVELWQKAIERHIAPRPIKRILLTHFHPDHSGMLGWFVENYDVEFITSRMTYFFLRALQLDVQELPTPHHERYWRRAGYTGEWIENRMATRPFNMLDTTYKLPLGVTTIRAGDRIKLAGREWEVRFGQGHAPDHVTLWHDDFAIIGDQCLPLITPVISIFPTEPKADMLHEFMKASVELASHARDDQLFLCGHNRPFYGGKSRLEALAHHHETALDQLRAELAEPKTMIDCYDFLFKRKITPSVEGFAISEATAHFNYLELRGEIESFTDQDGVIRWRLT